MDNLSEIMDWAEEYIALVHADYPGTVPAERQILENSRLMIMNNAVAHLMLLAPLDFISSLPRSDEYFFSKPAPWWMTEQR